jgi:hypothetical protein
MRTHKWLSRFKPLRLKKTQIVKTDHGFYAETWVNEELVKFETQSEGTLLHILNVWGAIKYKDVYDLAQDLSLMDILMYKAISSYGPLWPALDFKKDFPEIFTPNWYNWKLLQLGLIQEHSHFPILDLQCGDAPIDLHNLIHPRIHKKKYPEEDLFCTPRLKSVSKDFEHHAVPGFVYTFIMTIDFLVYGKDRELPPITQEDWDTLTTWLLACGEVVPAYSEMCHTILQILDRRPELIKP